MDAEALVLAILNSAPGHEVRGRKRLQKLAFFALETGTSAEVRFFLWDYGPFSTQVAAAADILSYVGAITEEEAKFSKTKRYYKVYRLSDPKSVTERLPARSIDALEKLGDYSTIELEVASTIRYFISIGYASERAIQATKELKPSKAEPNIVSRAEDALSKVGLYERGRTDQMSDSRSY
jgi:uncharacterized protein YwgA